MVEQSKIRSFRDLRVWQMGMDLVEETYRLTQDFPKDELYGLTGQMRRAAVSIPSNIAEGHAREYLKEYLQHISVAQGSLAELQTQAEIGTRLGYIDRDRFRAFDDFACVLQAAFYALRNACQEAEACG